MTNKYQLKIYPDAVLRQQAHAVANVDGRIDGLVTAMQDIMYMYRGIGLAAPQVGVLERIIIADIGEGLLSVLNPIIIQQEGQDSLIEGCLSLPDVAVDIQRHQDITLTGVNIEGEEIKMDIKGLLARVVQHEIDHLNGKLIIDYEESQNSDRKSWIKSQIETKSNDRARAQGILGNLKRNMEEYFRKATSLRRSKVPL